MWDDIDWGFLDDVGGGNDDIGNWFGGDGDTGGWWDQPMDPYGPGSGWGEDIPTPGYQDPPFSYGGQTPFGNQWPRFPGQVPGNPSGGGKNPFNGYGYPPPGGGGGPPGGGGFPNPFGGGPGGGGDQPGGVDLSNPQILAALANAWSQWNDSDKYADNAEAAMGKFDPFGKERGFYQDQLRNSYEDPQKFIEQDPSYQFNRREGLSALGQSKAASGGMVFDTSGNPTGGYAKGILDYSQGLADRTLTQQRAQLHDLTGSQFGPSAAAGVWAQGQQNSMDARNRALASIFSLLGQSRSPGQQRPPGMPGAPIEDDFWETTPIDGTHPGDFGPGIPEPQGRVSVGPITDVTQGDQNDGFYPNPNADKRYQFPGMTNG